MLGLGPRAVPPLRLCATPPDRDHADMTIMALTRLGRSCSTRSALKEQVRGSPAPWRPLQPRSVLRPPCPAAWLTAAQLSPQLMAAKASAAAALKDTAEQLDGQVRAVSGPFRGLQLQSLWRIPVAAVDLTVHGGRIYIANLASMGCQCCWPERLVDRQRGDCGH